MLILFTCYYFYYYFNIYFLWWWQWRWCCLLSSAFSVLKRLIYKSQHCHNHANIVTGFSFSTLVSGLLFNFFLLLKATFKQTFEQTMPWSVALFSTPTPTPIHPVNWQVNIWLSIFELLGLTVCLTVWVSAFYSFCPFHLS